MEHFCAMAHWLGKTDNVIQISKKGNRTMIIFTTVFFNFHEKLKGKKRMMRAKPYIHNKSQSRTRRLLQYDQTAVCQTHCPSGYSCTMSNILCTTALKPHRDVFA